MTAHFGRPQVYFVRRKRLPVRNEVADFQAVVRAALTGEPEALAPGGIRPQRVTDSGR